MKAPMKSDVSSDVVIAHVVATNPHRGTARDALQALPYDMRKLRWQRRIVPLDRLPAVHPASIRDVKRYARHPGILPEIVLVERRTGIEVIDGAHRIAAARLRGDDKIPAYVGK